MPPGLYVRVHHDRAKNMIVRKMIVPEALSLLTIETAEIIETGWRARVG
jgi:hypothetical protein